MSKSQQQIRKEHEDLIFRDSPFDKIDYIIQQLQILRQDLLRKSNAHLVKQERTNPARLRSICNKLDSANRNRPTARGKSAKIVDNSKYDQIISNILDYDDLHGRD